jgi:hypothetical protein
LIPEVQLSQKYVIYGMSNMGLLQRVLIFIVFFSAINNLYAKDDDSNNLFYINQSYGSESQFGGLNVFTNTGFVVSGRYTTPFIFDDIDYDKNFSTVVKSFTRQYSTIKKNGGAERFLSEFNPFHSSGRILPNFGLHFIGEGMLSRKLEEYYRMQGYSYPRVSAIATVVASQLMNETVETNMPWYDPVDSLADIYWNVAGMVAFSNDDFAKFFSNELVNLYYWPGQPIIDVKDRAIYNQGESYMLRAGKGNLKFALGMGIPINGIGASYTQNGYDNFTVLLGTDLALPRTNWQKSEQEDDETANEVMLSLAIPSVQFYWDRNGSLMASMMLGKITQCSDGLRAFKNPSGKKVCANSIAEPVSRSHFSFNLYPIEIGNVAIGGYLIISEAGASSTGITFNYPPISLGRRYN